MAELTRRTEQLRSESETESLSFGKTARTIAAGFAALIVGVGTAEGSEPTRPQPITAKSSNPRTETLGLMERRFTLEVSDYPLSDLVRTVSELGGVAIEALWTPAGSAGLQREQEVTIALRNITVREALERIGRVVEGESGETTWQVLSTGRLQFGAKESLDRFQERRIYDLRDAANEAPLFLGAPRFNFNAALNQGRGGGGSIIGEPREGAGGVRRTSEEGLDTLKEVILETVEPQQWVEQGGSGGTIRFYNGTMIVRAAPYVHRALGG